MMATASCMYGVHSVAMFQRDAVDVVDDDGAGPFVCHLHDGVSFLPVGLSTCRKVSASSTCTPRCSHNSLEAP